MDNDETSYLVCVGLPTESLFEPYSRITQRFTDIDIAVTFIESRRHVHILLVVSDRLAKEILSRIELCHHRHVRNIFILNQSTGALKIKFDKHDSLLEIFETESELEHAVQTQIISMEKQALPFSVFDQTQQSSKDVTKKFNTFLWYQVLFHTLKQLPADEQAREEMLQFCSDYYQSNPREEQIIQEYRLYANEDNAIHWYTRNTFFFKLANQALRTEDMLLVYRFRYWVKLLCSAIECEHQRQDNDELWTLYSGFRLHKDELERLKQSVGNLISINSFLSTSRSINLAQIFAGRGPIESHLVRVLLHIEANPTRLQSVFCADIHGISQFPEEEEVLFSLGSTFRILTMDFDEENQHWIFSLTATDDVRDQIHEYCQLANYDFRSTTPMIYFGRILNENLDQTSHATRYFHELLRITGKTHHDLPEIYDALGDTYFRRKEIAEAIKYYKIEQKIRRKRNITPIQPDEKIREKLLKELQEEEKRTDEPSLTKASLLCTLTDYVKYIQAEIYLTRALQIYERLHVASPSMSKCIDDLAWKCRQNGNHQRSLELQYQRLAISEKYLPVNNQTLSDILTDILNELLTPDNHRQFIRFCKRKLSVLDEDGSLDKDHPRLIHIKDCLQRAQNQLKKFKEQQKKWLGELSLSTNQKDPYQLSLLYQNVSIFYFKNGLYNESISYLLNELEIYENILGYNPRIFKILYEIQECYTFMLDYTQAFIYTQIAFRLAQSVEHICHGIVQDRQTKTDNFVRRVAKYQIELPWTPLTPDNDPFF